MSSRDSCHKSSRGHANTPRVFEDLPPVEELTTHEKTWLRSYLDKPLDSSSASTYATTSISSETNKPSSSQGKTTISTSSSTSAPPRLTTQEKQAATGHINQLLIRSLALQVDNKPKAAIQLAQEALETADSLGLWNLSARSQFLLGQAYGDLKQWDKAKHAFVRAASLKDVYGLNKPGKMGMLIQDLRMEEEAKNREKARKAELQAQEIEDVEREVAARRMAEAKKSEAEKIKGKGKEADLGREGKPRDYSNRPRRNAEIGKIKNGGQGWI